MNLSNISLRQIFAVVVLILAIVFAAIGKLDLFVAGMFALLALAVLFP